jgi:hypothetical protein
VRITLFSVEEANRLVVEIRPQVEKVCAQKREFDRLEMRMGLLRVATQGADERNPDARELVALGEKRQRLGERIARQLGELQEFGVVVKDIDRGLCDFYALMGDRLVFLCWQLSEPEVAHWHALDAGFGGRRPLKGAEIE